jgi:arylesterase/paraoxonase
MKWVFSIVGAIILIAAVFFMRTLIITGEFKRLEPHFNGTCEKVFGAIGAEDITIHPETGLAFVSANDRKANQAGQRAQGAIYGYNLQDPKPQLINLTEDFRRELYPHGISLYTEQGRTRLFVINHLQDADYVELFEYREGRLIHLDSIQDELMHSPNDLLAVGLNRFYVTNDHGSTTGLARTLEEYLMLPKANVLYYDGKYFTVAAERIAYANGINISPDGSTLYVASTTGLRIRVFSRKKDSGELTFLYDIKLKTGVDNIEVDRFGQLWVAAHPKLLSFTKHAADPSQLSPSQILKITFQDTGEIQIEEIFLDAGDTISGSSVAAVFGEFMLIGPVFVDHFLHCRL